MNDARHDPLSILLNGPLGFRAARPPNPLRPVIEDPECCALALPPAAATARTMDEPSGSLGGVRPPANVALGPDGDIYLLDRSRLLIKRFDRCRCRFEPVPCLGGEGPEPRQMFEPGGMAIGCGRIYFAQRDRVTVLALKGFGLLGDLLPPPAQRPWAPVAVALDSLGRVWVADRLGMLHRFTPHGRWEMRRPLPAAPAHLAIDRHDRLYVVLPGLVPSVIALDRNGQATGEAPAGPAQLRRRFPRLPFRVAADGKLLLEPCCDPCSVPAQRPGHQRWFDLNGDPVDQAAPAVLYETQGTYRSALIDSGIAQCVWHRAVITGRLPPGTRLRVAAFATDEPVEDDALGAVGVWQPCATATAFDGGASWDCLLRAVPGRYLSLELELEGNGAATPAVDAIVLEFPRISLRRYLPAVFGAESHSADFMDRFLALFDTTLRGIERRVDELPHLFDPGSAPASTADPGRLDHLSWLGSWIGLAPDRSWSTGTRRRLAGGAGARFDRRGTPGGLTEQLYVVLGFDRLAPCAPETARCGRCVPPPLNCAPAPTRRPALPPLVLEHFRLRRWLWLGRGRLDDAAVLWGEQIVRRTRLGSNGQLGVTRLDTSPDPERDPWLVHGNRFSVFVPARLGRDERACKGLESMIRAESPAGTEGTVHYVEPRFRIGIQSMLGFDAVIAAVPEGMRLGATPLGAGSMLTEPPHLKGAPRIALGRDGRIGTTTLLA